MISDFQRLYATLGENNPSLSAEDPRSGVLCELYKKSKTKYLRLNRLSQFLFVPLDRMDIYAKI